MLSSSIVWAIVVLTLLFLVNYRYGQWAASQKSLATQQYEELSSKIEKMRREISSLNMKKGFEDV